MEQNIDKVAQTTEQKTTSLLEDGTFPVAKEPKIEGLTPKQIVQKLDTYIIGQQKAKRYVAVALRNRSRRLCLPEEIRDEVAPKNILMIGPTGVGKTEIARRLAKLCGAPFLKVEATKYTEVGYVGRDVESMVRDLMAVGFNTAKSEAQEDLRSKCEPKVEEELLDLLLPGSDKKKKPLIKLGDIMGKKAPPQDAKKTLEVDSTLPDEENKENNKTQKEERPQKEKVSLADTREKFRTMLRNKQLEDRMVEISVQNMPSSGTMEIFAGGNIEDLESSIRGLSSLVMGAGRGKKRTVTIKEARNILMQENLDRMVDYDKVAEVAKNRVEQSGIIFIDEIDKIAVKGEHSGGDVARDGVQRDILPIVEGCSVNTKYGIVNTDHILFIAAGAFSLSKPSDLIPELQGRFPLRVELDSLHKEEFKRILTEPKNALTKQYKSLLGTEGVELNFSPDSIERISTLAEDVNSKAENIGARRLHTLMEAVLEDLSFDADEHKGEKINIDSNYVNDKLKDVIEDQDLSRYIL